MSMSCCSWSALKLLPTPRSCHCCRQNRPVWLVVNKIDKHDKGLLLLFIQQMAKIRFRRHRSGQRRARPANGTVAGCDPAEFATEGIPLYPEEQITDKSERVSSAEIVRESCFRLFGEELPYSINVEI